MVSRPPALRCLVTLGLLMPRVINAAPAEDESGAEAQTDETTAPDTDAPAAEGALDEDPVEGDADEPPSDGEPSDADVDDDGAMDGDVAPQSPLPDRLPRLQRIGWYHVLGAFTLGTTAGLLAGLAEREEDRATRIASGYDFETGAATLYRERQAQYERILDRGQALETSAIVVGALAGATTIAAITLFAIDARRTKPSTTARRTRLGPGSLEVSF